MYVVLNIISFDFDNLAANLNFIIQEKHFHVQVQAVYKIDFFTCKINKHTQTKTLQKHGASESLREKTKSPNFGI